MEYRSKAEGRQGMLIRSEMLLFREESERNLVKSLKDNVHEERCAGFLCKTGDEVSRM